MTIRKAKLVVFGRGGDTVYIGGYNRLKICGYGTPEQPHAASPANHQDIDFEGCPVLDVCPAVETDDGFWHAIAGPMVNVDLAPGERDAWIKDRKELAPFDYVSVQEYIKLWRKVGARVGKFDCGKIVWENGTADNSLTK